MVRLEPLRTEHAGEMLSGLSVIDGYRFLPDEPPVDLAELACRYERQALGRSEDGVELWHNWIVRDVGSSAALGYTQATIRASSALISYHVFPRYWRSGIGYAALVATLDQVFRPLNADCAWALVDTRNVASIALLTKLGFSVSRRHDGVGFFKGEASDEWEFELKRSAWAQS